MNDGELLLRQILENPDDNTLRRVYADWLQEQGDDEGAARIRFQIELRDMDEEAYEALDEDIKDYLADCYRTGGDLPSEWLSLQPPQEFRCDWDRGFVGSVSCPWDFFQDEEHLRQMFSTHPIERLHLHDTYPQRYHQNGQPSGGFPIGQRRLDFHALPRELALLLPSGELGSIELPESYEVMEGVSFQSKEAALRSLSIGTVRYGRRLVGLPDLTW